ncbi:sigma-70 family RNA polymerase sigma factor [Chitinophaga oryzae]|uniref:Sigma-70 family RNA polymerase sigma factor n=1 Tax=Chitinophaga oryzae TaxID=2725414 RepID=A0AAE7D5A5_9BACT|nr:sigma-70 family RNA polymerase sigma factor [Chitinophaga oryzae]QJB30433.1 sigma-70 family RNA polymerase sigma factor [Chitinophaga oryzae]QJB36943.1 sigma-70 family RNA polymerase sigma factor [Chitinophaga oryzae]
MTAFEQYRPTLFAVAYKMTKNAMDAEDILQDVFLAYSRQDAATIVHPENYLVKAVMHRCLSLLEARKKTVYPGIDLPSPLFRERFSYIHDSDISFALLILLQTLNPWERAVFILRETFSYSYAEMAAILGLEQDHCRQLFHRAKVKIAAGKLRYIPGGEQRSTLFQAFAEACSTGDTARLMACLKEDITIYSDGGGKVSAARAPLTGRTAAAAFLLGIYAKRGVELSLEVTTINGETGVIFRDATGAVDTVMILSMDTDGIHTVYFVRNPDKLR